MYKIFADFNNSDSNGRVRLNTNGTLSDLKNQDIELKEGLEIILDDMDEFSTVGIVEFSKNENIWVAKVDWNSLK